MKIANDFVNAYLYRVRQRKVKAFQMWVVTRFTTHTRLNDDDDLPLVGCEDYVDVVVLVVDRLLGGSFSPRQKNFRGRTRRLEFTKFWSTFEGKQVVKSHRLWMMTRSWKVSKVIDSWWVLSELRPEFDDTDFGLLTFKTHWGTLMFVLPL